MEGQPITEPTNTASNLKNRLSRYEPFQRWVCSHGVMTLDVCYRRPNALSLIEGKLTIKRQHTFRHRIQLIVD